MANINIATYTRLRFWVQLALPAVYEDSLSYVELLNKVVDRLNELGEDYNELVRILEETSYDYTQMLEDIEFLKSEVQKIEQGDYVSEWKDALFTLLDENIKELWARGAQFVQFGLTQSGFFYVDIPENWDFLQFSTIYDMNDPNYLHLVLEY